MKDKLLDFILRGECHLFTTEDLRKLRREAEKAGRNLEKAVELDYKGANDGESEKY